MRNKLIFKVAIILFLSSSSTAFAWRCAPYLTTWVNGIFASSQASLLTFFGGLMQKFMLQNLVDNQKTTSAIAILTKQKAVGSQKIMQAQTLSTQTMAKAYANLEQSKRLKETQLAFGPQFGQGYDVCKVTANRQLLGQKWVENQEQTEDSVKTELVARLGGYQSSSAAIRSNLQKQISTYCNADQEKLGLCKKSDAANQNIQISSLFQSTAKNTPEHQAKIDYINQLVGLPDDATLNQGDEQGNNQGNQGNNANAQSVKAMHYQLLKKQKDAMISPAVYSLKYIQNLYTKQGATSPLELMQYETRRYMGAGDDGKNWYKTMSTQHQRGLMLELLKIKSLDLNIQYKQYQQQQRMELILANLLASEAQKIDLAAPQ